MKRFVVILLILLGLAVYHYGWPTVQQGFNDSAEIIRNTSLDDLVEKKEETQKKIANLQENVKSAYNQGEEKVAEAKAALDQAQTALSEIQEALEKLDEAKENVQGIFGNEKEGL